MWVNHGEVDGAQAKQAFSSLDAVFALKGEAVTSSSLCSVDKVVFAEGDTSKAFYIKRYCRAGEGLSGIVGISKARREWQNLLRFADWGLPVAQLAAYGEEAWTMSSRRGVVVTGRLKTLRIWRVWQIKRRISFAGPIGFARYHSRWLMRLV